MKKYLYGTIAGLIAAAFLLVGSSGFLAVNAAPTGVQAGQLCAKKDAGEVKVASNGKTVRCEKDNRVYRWKYFTPPVATSSSGSASQSASASSSASSSASASASASNTASSSASVIPTPPPNTQASLPLTGSNPWLLVWLVTGGLVFIGAGTAIYRGTRRRTRFTP